MPGTAVGKIINIIGLQQLVHHAALRDIQSKKLVFIESVTLDELVIFDGETVDGVVLTERALVYPAIGKYKKILCHSTGTIKLILRI